MKDLNIFLALILDKFKAKNPMVYALMVFVVAVLHYAAVTGSQVLGLFELPQVIAEYVPKLGIVVAFLLQSRTSRFVEQAKEA